MSRQIDVWRCIIVKHHDSERWAQGSELAEDFSRSTSSSTNRTPFFSSESIVNLFASRLVFRKCYNCVTIAQLLIQISDSNAHQAHEQRTCHNSGRVTTMAQLSRSKGSGLRCDKRRKT